MLVDNHNPLQYQPYPSSANFNDLNDFFNTDLFANDILAGTLNAAASTSNSPATASSSRASSPQSPYQSNLLTPPQSQPVHVFPEYSPSSFFNFLDDEPSKQLDPISMSMSSSAPFDFMSAFSGATDVGMDSSTGMDVSMDMSNLGTSTIGLANDAIGIDPQLVGTPSTLSETVEEEEEEESDDQEERAETSVPDVTTNPTTSKSSSAKKSLVKEKEQNQEQEKLTLVIQPVKVAGHGKARKGTILSGGITKKTASSAPLPSAATTLARGLDITNSGSFTVPAYTPPSAFTPTNIYPSKSSSAKAGNEDKDEDEDDLPQDWRPSPEVFAKMTSKEKRQLRNKISARNFRVRRKEYISTLEGDIAERDRLLDAIRTELGSTQSENFALRQEIAALKRTLLDGRDPSASDELPLHLPPPAPLPAQSAAATLAQQQFAAATSSSPSPTTTTTQLLTANTQKDASVNGRFWGGANSSMRLGMGGITPVHRVMMPEVSVTDLLASQFKRAEKLQENMNPLLNDTTNTDAKSAADTKMPTGFDSFTDVNPFTMKTLDAYRMHLWGKMAAQHQSHLQQQQLLQQHQNQNLAPNHLTGLASSLRPAFFATPNFPSPSSKHSLLPPYTTPPSTTTPSTPPPPYQSTPPSPILGLGKSGVLEKLEREREREKERERERQREKEASAMVATIASQTLLRKLGSAFWDAFSGSSSAPSVVNTSVHGAVGGNAFASGSSAGAGVSNNRAWDADKVRRVLEGKAVVRVVDIEDLKLAKVSQMEKSECATRKCSCTAAMTDILEESMRSLSIGKKA